jgi:hypothetical protein
MGQSRMNNPETLPKLGIQDIDKDKQNTKKHKTENKDNEQHRHQKNKRDEPKCSRRVRSSCFL